MLLYHGSPVKSITQFHLDLPRFESVEGSGLYLTPLYSMAKGYAGSEGSIYVCRINSGHIFDATVGDSFINLLKNISHEISFNILDVNYINETIDGLLSGEYQITDEQNSGLSWQIKNLLYNDESFSSLENSEGLMEKIVELVGSFMKNHSVLKYNDKSLGLIYLCKDLNVLKIENEIQVGSPEDQKID